MLRFVCFLIFFSLILIIYVGDRVVVKNKKKFVRKYSNEQAIQFFFFEILNNGLP